MNSAAIGALSRRAGPRPRRADHRGLGRGFLPVIAGPIPAIRDLPERVLIDLAQALRAGRLTAATAFTVRFAVPAVSEAAAAELSSLLASGLGQQHAALLLDALAGRGEARKGFDDTRFL